MVQRNALRSFLLAPLACTLLAQLCAQDSLLDPRKLVLIDRVVATVNDTVILYSELKTLSSGEERTAEIQKGGKLTLPELRIIQTRNLQELINRAALAQAAKTLGVLPPERVEEIFQEMLEDDRKQQIRDFGTLMKFSEELQKTNRTWETYERDQRLAKLSDLTKQMAVYGRLQNQRGLFITPRMMRQHFARNQVQMAEKRAKLAIIAFPGTTTLAAANEAAEAWRQAPSTPSELATQFRDRGARELGVHMINDKSTANRPLKMVQFALAGPINNVQVVPQDASIQVWKITDYSGGTTRSFDDPTLQVDIRRILERQVVNFLTNQTIQRARERTEPWQPLGDIPTQMSQSPPPDKD